MKTDLVFDDIFVTSVVFDRTCRALLGGGSAMPIRTFTQPGAFEPEAIAAMSEAFEAALKELPDAGEHEVTREVIARRIIAAARLGERDPERLREAALRKPD